MATGLSVQEKALAVNLDPSIYGTLAEIGAGQEVARCFFRAGAASKTIAKTMSAYDMTFSDAIYGPEASGRYVCESRLKRMLSHEYSLLIERLWNKRADDTRFFAFADTVAATSYKRIDQEGRGWIGVRYQRTIRGEANEIVLHVRLFDRDLLVQQERLGVLGVNLIHGAYFLIDTPDEFLSSLVDEIKDGAVEIEMIHVSGPDLQHIDNKVLALKLIEKKLTHAILFSPKGEMLQPSEALFRKNVIVLRGQFRPFTNLNQDMFLKGKDHFCLDRGGCDVLDTIVILEMTIKLLSTEGKLDYVDTLGRIEMINNLGHHVLISEFFEYYKLRQYLSRYTSERVGIMTGAIQLEDIFDPKYYEDLKGGILEAFGRLFSGKSRMYIYPATHPSGQGLLTLESYVPHEEVAGLYYSLKGKNLIVDMKDVDGRFLHIRSHVLAEKIRQGDALWEEDVPLQAAEIIKSKRLFR